MDKWIVLSLSLVFVFNNFAMETRGMGFPERPKKNKVPNSAPLKIVEQESDLTSILDRFERVFDRLEFLSGQVTSLQERVEFLQDKLAVLHKMEQSNLTLFESLVQRVEALEYE